MRRFAAVFSLFVFAVSFAVLVMPHTAACPISSPVPLRGLFLKSDIVVVGKIGTPGKWKSLPRSEQDYERYQSYNRTIPVQVEETIKGVPPKGLAVMENRSQWVSDQDEPKSQVPGLVKLPNEPEFDSSLAENKDRRIFFLIRDDDDDYYREVYSSRHFEPEKDELPVFISRLRELQNIYSAPTPSKQMIVEWLVSLAEDPVTRWDGAYELSAALTQDDDEDEETAEPEDENAAPAESSGEDGAEETSAKENAAEETAVVPVVELGAVTSEQTLKIALRGGGPDDFYTGNGQIAKLLTAGQKERLIQAFLNIRFNYKVIEKPESDDQEDTEEDEEPSTEYEPVLNDADDTLLTVVGELHDPRVIDRLVYELSLASKYNSWQASEMIDILAEGFDDDDKLSALAGKYSDIAWRDGDELIEYEDQAYDKPAVTESAQIATPTEEEKVAANELQNARKKAYVRSKTYGQRRAELLQQILSRYAELALAEKNRK